MTNTKSQPQTVGIQKLDGSAEPGETAQRVGTKGITDLQFVEHLYMWVSQQNIDTLGSTPFTLFPSPQRLTIQP